MCDFPSGSLMTREARLKLAEDCRLLGVGESQLSEGLPANNDSVLGIGIFNIPHFFAPITQN